MQQSCSKTIFYGIPDLRLTTRQVKPVLRARSEIKPMHFLPIKPTMHNLRPNGRMRPLIMKFAAVPM